MSGPSILYPGIKLIKVKNRSDEGNVRIGIEQLVGCKIIDLVFGAKKDPSIKPSVPSRRTCRGP